MKQFLYTILVLLIGSPVFATFTASKNNQETVKVIKARQKHCSKKKQKKTERRPVPKISVSNPEAMKEV